MRLTAAEHRNFLVPRGAATGDTEPHPMGRVVTHPGNVVWGCACIFFLPYSIENGAAQPVNEADGSGGVGAPGAGGVEAMAALVPLVGDDTAAGAILGQGSPAPGADGQPRGGAAPVSAVHQARLFFCPQRIDAVPVVGDAAVMREQWRVFQRFMHTFLAEPVVGAFAGLDRLIRLFAVDMARSVPGRAWLRSAEAVESVGVVWPLVRLIASVTETDMVLVRAVGKLLLFACGVDAYWKTMWRSRASPAALDFESQWKETSVAKFKEWRSANPVAFPAPVTRLSARASSLDRVLPQALEARTGNVWPDLECVRTFIIDSKANVVNATRATTARTIRAGLEAALVQVFGADDCRHTFNSAEVYYARH